MLNFWTKNGCLEQCDILPSIAYDNDRNISNHSCWFFPSIFELQVVISDLLKVQKCKIYGTSKLSVEPEKTTCGWQ